jgi:hypothetical protein
MRTTLLVLIASLALPLAACGTADTKADAPDRSQPPPGTTAPAADQLYEANATVLEDGSHGPMLCLAGILESLPPQCGNVPIANWDWGKVQDEESVGGTTWGSYHVVGSYDGETFAVTDIAPYENGSSRAESEADFSSPCAEPKGGSSGVDGATQDDTIAALDYARAQRDYVTSWVTHLDPEAMEFSPVILNVVFTGDPQRHEAEIRKVWSGRLCVVERELPTASELSRIRKEVESNLDELGLEMLWSDGPGLEPVIEIGVVVDLHGRAQATLERRYGAGVVRIVPALEPIS